LWSWALSWYCCFLEQKS